MRVETGVAPVNGAELYYERAGVGDPVVLVHAGIADSRMWDPQFEVLAAEYTVVRCDLRGYGRTPAVKGPFSHHEDVIALLRYLGLERAALVGCSMGGKTVIDAALAAPDAVAALVPIASALSGYKAAAPDPPQWQAAVDAYGRGDLEQASEYEVQIWVDGPTRRPDVVPAAIRDLVREMNLIPLAVPDELVDERPLEPPAAGRLHELTVPTLVVIGELDQPAPIAQCRFIAEQVASAETVTLRTAHLPNLERPEEFNDVLRGFLRRALGTSAPPPASQ